MNYKCPKCGNVVLEGTNPCPNCGQQFKWPEQASHQDEPTIPMRPIFVDDSISVKQDEAKSEVDSAFETNVGTNTKKKRMSKKKIILFVVMGLILIAMIVPAMSSLSEDDAQASEPVEERYLDILEKSSSSYGLEFNCTLDQFITNYNSTISQEGEISQAFNSKISRENSFSGQQTFDGISATVYSWSLYGALGNGTKVENGSFVVAVDNSTNKIVEVDYYISTEWLNSTNEMAYETYTSKMPNMVFSSVGVDNAVEKYFNMSSNYSNGLIYKKSESYISNLPVVRYSLSAATKEYYETLNSVQSDSKSNTNQNTSLTKESGNNVVPSKFDGTYSYGGNRDDIILGNIIIEKEKIYIDINNADGITTAIGTYTISGNTLTLGSMKNKYDNQTMYTEGITIRFNENYTEFSIYGCETHATEVIIKGFGKNPDYLENGTIFVKS